MRAMPFSAPRLRALLAALTALAAAGPAMPNAFAQGLVPDFGFSPPAPVDSGSSEDTRVDEDRTHGATDGRGVWVIVWNADGGEGEPTGPDDDIFFARSMDNGATWTPPLPLNSNADSDSGDDRRPVIATDGKGRWITAWQSEDPLGGGLGPDFDILFARSTDNGATWSAPKALNRNASSDLGSDTRPRIANNGADRWVVVWQSTDSLGGTIGNDSDILVARSSDRGRTWSGVKALNSHAASDAASFGAPAPDSRLAPRGFFPPDVDTEPDVVTDGAGLWVAVWESDHNLAGEIGDDDDILFALSTNNGRGWTDAAPLNTTAGADGLDDEDGPRIATDAAGNFIVVWEHRPDPDDPDNSDDDVLSAASLDGAQSWLAPVAVAERGVAHREPNIAAGANGAWIAVWESRDSLQGLNASQDKEILISRSTDIGRTWTPPAPLNSDVTLDRNDDEDPFVFTDGLGAWIVTWNREFRDDGGDIVDVDVFASRSLNIDRIAEVDFTAGGGDANGWVGGAAGGFGGSTSIGTSGLCMSVPLLGENFVVWVSPERYLDLVDNSLYRIRAEVSTDQSRPDAIPLWFIVYDNFQTNPGAGNNFGGEFWFLDVAGGAEGVGRAQGRNSFEVLLAPNAAPTPQWREGAFTPAADFENDLRLQFRVIDANAALLSDIDEGSICIERIEISVFSRDRLALDSTLYDPPLNSATHFAEAFDEIAVGGTAAIDNVTATARYALAVTGTARKTLGPYDPLQPDLNSQLFPVPWEHETLYRVRASISAESSEADPVEAIFLAIDTATAEIGMSQFTTRGAPGGAMDRVASPKLLAAEYEAYLFSHNVTLSMVPNAARLRPLAFFFNTANLYGEGTGADAFAVHSLAVDRMTLP